MFSRGAEFPDGNLVQFVILRTERIETLFAVHQKTETFAVGELRDENLADLQRVRNVGTAHERAAADLLHVVDAQRVVHQQVAVVVPLARRGVAGDDAGRERKSLVPQDFGECRALLLVDGVGLHIDELDSLAGDAEHVRRRF